jgi:hypothetical protein
MHGANVNSVDVQGQTPLHRVSDYECTVLLLAAGASVTALDHSGQTPLVSARKKSVMEFVRPAFLAAGADPSDVSQQSIADVSARQFESARRDIAKTRLDFVRCRAMHVCIGLQSLRLDALQLCEILQHACGPLAHLIAFHQWWKIATTVKHFQQQQGLQLNHENSFNQTL